MAVEYYIASTMTTTAVALHVTGDVIDQNGTYYILGDHLGSANTLVKDGDVVSEQRFLPFGERRTWAEQENAPWQTEATQAICTTTTSGWNGRGSEACLSMDCKVSLDHAYISLPRGRRT